MDVGSLLGGLGSGLFGLAGQIYNINQQKEMNRIQMQREDTAVQRRVADLKSAGLNPYLAMANGGQGASTGQLNAPNISTDFISQAQQGFMKKAEIESIKQGIEQKEAETDVLKFQRTVAKYQARMAQMAFVRDSANFGLQFGIPMYLDLNDRDLSAIHFSYDTMNPQHSLTSDNPFATSFERDMNIQKLIEGQQNESYLQSLVDTRWANANQWLNAIYGGINAASDVADSLSYGKRAFNPVRPKISY